MKSESPFLEDIDHYQRMVASQDETITAMRELKKRHRGSGPWRVQVELATEIIEMSLDVRREFEEQLDNARQKHFRYLRLQRGGAEA